MSFSSWKREFYPKKSDTVKSEKEAIKHSLRKWQGLTKQNLKKHKITLSAGIPSLYPPYIETKTDSFFIDYTSCSLCYWSFDHLTKDCDECPLGKIIGDSCGGKKGPYAYFTKTNDPTLMINALKKCLKENS